MIEYKSDLKRQIKLLKSDLIYWIVSVGIIGLFAWNTNYGDWTETIIVILIAFAPILIPLLIIHFNYLYKSHGLIVHIDKETESVVINKLDEIFKYGFNDIKEIIVVKGNHYKNEKKAKTTWNTINTSFRNPWTDYGYLRIIFNDNQYVNITAFMIDLNDIPFDNFKSKYSVLPLIKL